MFNTYIIIPAFNEQKRIGQVIENLLSSGFKNIVVVNDGSTDNTSEAVASYNIHYVEHIINLGQGAALRTGTDYALKHGAENIVHFDSDGQMQVSDIEKFLNKLNEGFDIVIGSRYLNNESKIPWTKKYFIHKPGRYVNWLLTGLKMSDAHNGFRAMNRYAAEKIQITQNRMAHASEIPAEIKFHNLKYSEVPVDIIYYEYGQNIRGGISIVVDFVKQKILS